MPATPIASATPAVEHLHVRLAVVTPPGAAYPRNAHGLVVQCAWCRLVADAAGQFCLPSAAIIPSATHGCCPVCLAHLRRQTLAVRSRLAA